MEENDVLAVIDALERASVRYWIAGGWGIDVLVGEVTRAHSDLDLCIDGTDEASAIAELEGSGSKSRWTCGRCGSS